MGQPTADAAAIVLREYELGGRRDVASPPLTGNAAPDPTPPPAHGTPRALSPGGVGQVRGFVFDSTFGTPILNVSVTSASAVGSCSGGCSQTTTNSNGFFNLTAPAGGAVIGFDDSLYLSNKTWVT
ncbi:MAG: hypothetical protein L3J96_03280, partial [Thermoplasmata archaeon]|nr:hypothetical protein [Thermoplasmata archaeon]